eukprot:SM000027S09609  [mRNA]  locus=s27:343510:344953:+ [translate_table: standard]
MGGGGGGGVVEVTGAAHWDAQHAQARRDRKLVVVDFTATWCGPCRTMAPVFAELSARYGDGALFLKVDVDACPDVAQQCRVRAMPTFQVYRDAKKLDEVVGADRAGLEAAIKKHYAATSAAFSGQSYSLRSAAPDQDGTHTSGATQALTQLPAEATAVYRGPDESAPTTSIQIRLPDGSRLLGRFNLTDTIAGIHSFIMSSQPDLASRFQLEIPYPHKVLSDTSQTIEACGLANAAVTVKLL